MDKQPGWDASGMRAWELAPARTGPVAEPMLDADLRHSFPNNIPWAVRAFWASTEIRARILEFVQEQVTVYFIKNAACHRHHEAKERLASLLLVFEDRTQLEVLKVTQEFLAKMLITR